MLKRGWKEKRLAAWLSSHLPLTSGRGSGGDRTHNDYQISFVISVCATSLYLLSRLNFLCYEWCMQVLRTRNFCTAQRKVGLASISIALNLVQKKSLLSLPFFKILAIGFQKFWPKIFVCLHNFKWNIKNTNRGMQSYTNHHTHFLKCLYSFTYRHLHDQCLKATDCVQVGKKNIFCITLVSIGFFFHVFQIPCWNSLS